MLQVSPVSLKKKVLQRVSVDFDAVFEVFPEVKIGDLSAAEVDKLSADVDDAAIEKTLDILRKQRRTFCSAR